MPSTLSANSSAHRFRPGSDRSRHNAFSATHPNGATSWSSHSESRRELTAVLLLALGVYAGNRAGLSLELLQNIAFPLASVCILLILRKNVIGPPRTLIFLAMIAWGVGALHIRGYLPSLGSSRAVTLSILRGDVNDERMRDLLRRYNTIAQAYHLPPMHVRYHQFDTTEAGHAWLNRRSDTQMLIAGEAEWLNVIFPSSILELPLSEPVPSRMLSAEAARWGVELGNKTRIIELGDSGVQLVMGLAPESVIVPSEPSELARHYLGWLARGIAPLPAPVEKAHKWENAPSVDPASAAELASLSPASSAAASAPSATVPSDRDNLQDIDPIEQAFEYREDALSQTTMMLGAWKNSAPLSLGRFFLANITLLDTLRSPSVASSRFADALTQYYQARKILKSEFDSELLALIRNNIALTFIVAAEAEADRKNAESEFLKAASLTDPAGHPVPGARLAMLNLVLLEHAHELARREYSNESKQDRE